MAEFAMPAATTATTPAQQLNERFATIYAQHLPRITALVGSRIINAEDKHLTDDLTAEAFTQVWLHLHKCEATTDAKLFSWIATIARRTVAHHFRTKKNLMERPADLGTWQYANREMNTAGACYTPAATGFRTAPIATTPTSRCPRCGHTFEDCTCTNAAATR